LQLKEWGSKLIEIQIEGHNWFLKGLAWIFRLNKRKKKREREIIEAQLHLYHARTLSIASKWI
jgi:hypothetical protein